jgi:RNA-directed DNA polymerase
VGRLTSSGKSFDISKRLVMEAWEKVRANQGAPGVDAVGIEEFEADLQGNLYKIWNRMSSGCYFPPPVRMVEIPKPQGGVRVLGVPTVADRVAQTVVAMVLEAKVEPIFHPGSYGYRPGRSQLDAVAACRQRCWKYDWVIDLDIKAFFDSVPWDLILKAVTSVCDLAWVLLYVRRWLAAPLRYPDGTLAERTLGTSQGSAISPVLANLFMHYAFDTWLERTFPAVVFERYADDAVIHCQSLSQAREVLAKLEERMCQVGLQLHPDKTRIVYCKDANRKSSFEHTGFTFLGYDFRERTVNGQHGLFRSFSPAVSAKALKRMSAQVRSWRLHRWVQGQARDLADRINPVVRGWMQYYGAFNKSALYPLLKRINAYLVRWLRGKYRRLRRSWSRTMSVWHQGVKSAPRFFAHWDWITEPAAVW